MTSGTKSSSPKSSIGSKTESELEHIKTSSTDQYVTSNSTSGKKSAAAIVSHSYSKEHLDTEERSDLEMSGEKQSVSEYKMNLRSDSDRKTSSRPGTEHSRVKSVKDISKSETILEDANQEKDGSKTESKGSKHRNRKNSKLQEGSEENITSKETEKKRSKDETDTRSGSKTGSKLVVLMASGSRPNIGSKNSSKFKSDSKDAKGLQTNTKSRTVLLIKSKSGVDQYDDSLRKESVKRSSLKSGSEHLKAYNQYLDEVIGRSKSGSDDKSKSKSGSAHRNRSNSGSDDRSKNKYENEENIESRSNSAGKSTSALISEHKSRSRSSTLPQSSTKSVSGFKISSIPSSEFDETPDKSRTISISYSTVFQACPLVHSIDEENKILKLKFDVSHFYPEEVKF